MDRAASRPFRYVYVLGRTIRRYRGLSRLRAAGRYGPGVRRCVEGERGQSLVELALLLPILVFVLLGGADLARAYAAQIATQNAARAGAESAVLGVAATDAAIVVYARDELGGVPGVDRAAATITVTTKKIDGTTACAVPATIADPCYVTVRVQYGWRTLVAWPIVPNQVTFDRSTKMRKVG